MKDLVIKKEDLMEAVKAAVLEYIKFEKITVTKDDVLDMIKEAILDNVDVTKAAEAYGVEDVEDVEDVEEPVKKPAKKATKKVAKEAAEKPAKKPAKKAAKVADVKPKAAKAVSGGPAVDAEAEEDSKSNTDVRAAAKKLSKEVSVKGIAVRNKLRKIVAKYSENGSIQGIPDTMIEKYYNAVKKFAEGLE